MKSQPQTKCSVYNVAYIAHGQNTTEKNNRLIVTECSAVRSEGNIAVLLCVNCVMLIA
jgi:hypothetical protein